MVTTESRFLGCNPGDRLNAKEWVRLFEYTGWELVAGGGKGSHLKLSRFGCGSVTIPNHGKEPLGRGLNHKLWIRMIDSYEERGPAAAPAIAEPLTAVLLRHAIRLLDQAEPSEVLAEVTELLRELKHEVDEQEQQLQAARGSLQELHEVSQKAADYGALLARLVAEEDEPPPDAVPSSWGRRMLKRLGL